ncbi:hypothetical protein MBANPS3_009698 [Mucor bainieri]
MHNPYLNGSDANEDASQINSHVPQMSGSDQHSCQSLPSTTRRDEKHVLYIDDYTTTEEDHPPSYSSTQEQAKAFHSSDVDTRASARRYSVSTSDAIPLDPYHAHLPSEPETAPLMEPDSDRYTPPTAPPVDQIEINIFVLAFAVFVVGVILMATALAAVKCYSDGCEGDPDCQQCSNKIEKGFQAAVFSFFILVSLCIIWRFMKYIVL